MRALLSLALFYLLCLIQLGIPPYGPDLVLLGLLVFALHEDRLRAALFGFFCGLVLDLTLPAGLGSTAFAYALFSYSVSSLHSLIYRGQWHLVFLAAAGLLIRAALHALSAGPVALPALAVSAGLTLVLALPADRLLSRAFYSGGSATGSRAGDGGRR